MQIGDKFGRLTVVSNPFKPDPNKYEYFVDCECSCGSGKRSYRKVSLTKKTNPTKSCGCLQRAFASSLKREVPLGKVCDRLTITKDVGVIDGRRYVLTDCSCGTKDFKVRLDALERGTTKSCGCLYEERDCAIRHGMCGTREYSSWQAMKDRCDNPSSPSFQNYGGRGIKYDPSWSKFENFFADMGTRPDGFDLDRIDVNDDYTPRNCRWADATTQSHNRRKRGGTTSKYTGVYYDKAKSLWHARLHYYNKVVFSAYFSSEVDAAKAYDDACMEYYGIRKNFQD